MLDEKLNLKIKKIIIEFQERPENIINAIKINDPDKLIGVILLFIFEVHIEWNIFGFIINTSLEPVSYLEYYDMTMLVGGLIYCIGMCFGFFTFKSKSFPYISFVSTLMMMGGIFTFVAGAQADLNRRLYNINPIVRFTYNVKPFYSVQLGMILAFATLILLIVEMIVFLIEFDPFIFPKNNKTKEE